MVASVDYIVGDFINFLDKEGVLENTVVYIYPDHLKMGSPSIFKGTGERGLYLITNASGEDLEIDSATEIYQIDLPEITLKGAGIAHNAKFFTDYIKGDKIDFINNNLNKIVALNTSGLRILRETENGFYIDSLTTIKTEYFEEYIRDTSRFIAHAGGSIEGSRYTNSLEALNLSYSKGFRFFELDIIKTSGGKYVAAHDWEHWAKATAYKGDLPVSESEFLKHKILDKYSPLTMDAINKWFKEHEDAILVTDKVNDPIRFSDIFIDKKRLMMELFTIDAVEEGLASGIKSAMPSQNVIEKLEDPKVSKLISMGIKNIAVSRSFIEANVYFLKQLKLNNIRTYVYHINFEEGKDERYVVDYEMDYIFGIYADNWEFPKDSL